ncbi:MAG: hypothetical protein ABI321_24765 [Polyangia bacterium]
MANILCFMEQYEGELTPSSLETLGQARRLGSGLGATVYAAVALDRAPGYGEDDVLAKLAAGGADKVLLLVGENFGQPSSTVTWETHGPAVISAWDVSQPALMLVPASGCGREIAARAAARVGAAFLHDAFVEMQGGQLVLAEGRGERARRLPAALEFPVVATLPPGRYSAAAGDEEAEVEVLQVGAVQRFIAEPAPESARAPEPTLTKHDGHTLVELHSSTGLLTVALGKTAAQAQADFAIEGDADALLSGLFASHERSMKEGSR